VQDQVIRHIEIFSQGGILAAPPQLFKEEVIMYLFTIVFGLSILLLLAVIPAYAIDQSICDSGSKVVLDPNGSLRTCVLKDSFRSDGIKCTDHRVIRFYNDGRLETCDLAESTTVSGQKCKEFAPIYFYPDGKFKSCVKAD
jgi:hypothetical protein